MDYSYLENPQHCRELDRIPSSLFVKIESMISFQSIKWIVFICLNDMGGPCLELCPGNFLQTLKRAVHVKDGSFVYMCWKVLGVLRYSKFL